MSIKVNDQTIELPHFVAALDLRPIVECSDESYAERRQHFIDRAYSLQAEVNAENERLTADTVSSLDAKHDELVLKCREAKAKFDEVNLQASFFLSSENELSKKVNLAGFEIQLKKKSPLQPAYATKEDYQKWNDELAELIQAETAAMQRYNSHRMLQHQWQGDREKLAELHNVAVREEAQIRHRLERLTGESTELRSTSIGLSA